MSIFSWLIQWTSPRAPTQSPVLEASAPDSGALSFDDIADEFEHLQLHNYALKDQLREAHVEVSSQRQQLEDLQLQLRNADTEVQTLRRRLNNSEGTAGRKNNSHKAEIKKLESRLKERAIERKVLENNRDRDLALLTSKLKTACREYDLLLEYEDKLRKWGEDAQLQLEYLNCTTTNSAVDVKFTDDPVMPLPAQPFVVMLIDGDAYSWSRQISDPAYGRNPGALAAIRLHNCITKHILNYPNIPVTARIIVRIFINEGGRSYGADRAMAFGGLHKKMRAAFRADFNSTRPLFDYVDVGAGKEKADEKIRENFNVYLSNPQCHALFLAVCTDNGFARMLGPYQHHKSALQKLRLVSPGFVAQEIGALGFETLEWPSVFEMQTRDKQMLVVEASARRWDAHNKNIGHTGVRDEISKAAIIDFTNAVGAAWDINSMIDRCTRKVGLRLRSRQLTSWQPFERAMIEETYDQGQRVD